MRRGTRPRSEELRLLLLIPMLVLLPTSETSAQDDLRPRAVYPVQRASSAITLDGVLDEPTWREAGIIPVAYEWLPGDNTPAPVETEVRVTYDDDFLYVAFLARDPDPSGIRAYLRERDSGVTDDHIGILLDTFDDARRAFQFRVNPAGVQMDAFFSELEGIEDWSWDAIWDVGTAITAEGYVVEMAIPFSSLRFPRTDGVQTWGFQAFRSWPRSVRHRLSSNPVDRDRASVLAQIDRITGLQGITPGNNLEFDPTFTAVRTDELPPDPGFYIGRPPLVEGDPETAFGLTAKWGLTPNLILNGTLNPDFSQVEADVAQLDVNVRFTLFYPERRPFFLEGADFFATPVNTVFTRTIADPDWGVKLTGKEGRHAVGVFATRDRTPSLLMPGPQGSRFGSLDREVTSTVLRHRYDLGGNSTAGVLYAGREGTGYHNRVAGIDGFLRLSGSKTLNIQLLRTETRYPDELAGTPGLPEASPEGWGFHSEFSHQGRDWIAGLAMDNLGSGFRADAGFVPRVGIRSYSGHLLRMYWGHSEGWYNRLLTGFGTTRTEGQDGELLDADVTFVIQYFGPLQSQVNLDLGQWWERYQGVMYDHRTLRLQTNLQPAGGLVVGFNLFAGGGIDYLFGRDAQVLRLGPSVGWNPGRHLELTVAHELEQLEVEEGRMYTANLTQLRLMYHLDVRTFVRGIVQYRRDDKEPSVYPEGAWDHRDEGLFTQFLFSYRLNPQTVVFLGYSDNSTALNGEDLYRSGRTFFLKLGYALVL